MGLSDAGFLLLVFALTSAGAYAGGRRAGLAPGAFPPALVRLLECVGLAVAFYLLNLATGFLAVAVLRRLRGEFVSAYLSGDVTLLALSALQAVVLQWWRAES